MDIELIEIRDFLAAHPPFDGLNSEVLRRLLRKITIRYLRRGMAFPPADSKEPALYVVRQGAIELRDADDRLIELLNEGDLHFERCLVGEAYPVSRAVTREDTLFYQISCHAIEEISKDNRAFDHFFTHTLTERLQHALQTLRQSYASSLTNVHCSDLITRAPVVARADTSIEQAAQLMSTEDVSALLINCEGNISAIVTDRDLRNRCLAASVSSERPISDIMTVPLLSADSHTTAYEALLTMTQHGIHHLPIADNGKVIGMITATDLFRHQSTNTIHLAGAIRRSTTVNALIELAKQLPELQRQLDASGMTGHNIGKAVTAVIDALTVKLLELAEEAFGPPPVPYTWLVFGSQARMEQTAHTDQDNGLLIDDGYRPEHADYFERLANFVTSALARCGIPRCSGEVMASNPQWRQPLSDWLRYFSDWVEQPAPMALMHLSIFFDLRALHGATALAEQLRTHILNVSHSNTLFLAYLTANALHHRPPLGFFRQLVVIDEGEHVDTIDLKQHGIIPIVDLARIQALASGDTKLNTYERLQRNKNEGVLSQQANNNLRDVLDLLLTLRAHHQAEQIRKGIAPDNFLSPQQLSPLERRHLKDAFRVIATLQQTLAQRYQSERFD